MRRTLLASAGAVLAISMAGPAQAAYQPGTVTVGGRNVTATTSDIQFLGVSDVGYVAARNGGVLAVAGLQGHADPMPQTVPFHWVPGAGSVPVSDLTGAILRWAEPKGSSTTAWVIHRDNAWGQVLADTASADRPVAFTSDSWLGYANGVLKRHIFGGATTTLLTGITSTPVVHADDSGAAVLYAVAGANTRVGLITFTKAGIEVLADEADPATGELTNVALTPNSVVWTTNRPPLLITGVVHRRARTGGAVTNTDGPQGRPMGDLAATDDQAAVTRITGTAGVYAFHLWVLKGTTWREITLPSGDFNGLRAGTGGQASTLAFGVSGDDATKAGIWRIDAGSAPTRVGRPDSTKPGTITDVSLQAGRLTWAVRPSGAAPDWTVTPLRRAALGTGTTLTVGAAAPYADSLNVIHAYTGTPAPAIAVSGDRTALRVDSSGVRAWLTDDDGTIAAATDPVTSAEQPIRHSGQYTLIGGKVFRGDDLTPVLDLTARKCRGTDLFGPLVICNEPDGTNRILHADGRFAPGRTISSGTGEVAIWGTAVAYVAGTDIVTEDLSVPGSFRDLGAVGGVHDLRMTEGAIWWRDDTGVIRVLDRDERVSSQPVSTGLLAPADVDDHVAAGLTWTGDLQVRTLPFGQNVAYRPRLIDVVAPASFSPASAPWKPLFDTTKPLKNVRITIKQGTTVVTTLTGASATGTVRNLTWNGKTSAGADAPAGAYTWTFTADARDGDGSVTNTDGTNAVTGTVYMTR